MKLVLILVVLFASAPAFADTWTCPIKNPTRPTNWPQEILLVDFDETRLQTVNEVHKIPNGDGTFKDELELLFSFQGRNRGGFSIAYCESNDGHVSLEYGMVNMTSKCSTSLKQDPLYFRADFRSTQDGSLSVQVQANNGANNITRTIYVSSCH